MTARPLPRVGSWFLDVRGEGRGVRVSRHPERPLVNLTLWRQDVCVGSTHLAPGDVAGLVAALSEQLADLVPDELSTRAGAARVEALERRLTELEEQSRTPGWRRALARVTARRAPRRPAPSPRPVEEQVRLTLVG
ncbi:hypothetical protein GB931_03945 [Modestobacter sp. I12A-02628]|uniref:Uncharacterized protein n=1 Tax=Goekera deserti TaxID=2497753 RepID=A0A7K3WIM3_9ACTN|nr:hypothetical protein [Goekera deserti]MPQ97091.1 hypothetical protein [Goekera deserti]NDI46592.1 hypothetical protein [Goekera deserti]NEL56348.1 hypothetical protein [Goekera deserti]